MGPFFTIVYPLDADSVCNTAKLEAVCVGVFVVRFVTYASPILLFPFDTVLNRPAILVVEPCVSLVVSLVLMFTYLTYMTQLPRHSWWPHYLACGSLVVCFCLSVISTVSLWKTPYLANITIRGGKQYVSDITLYLQIASSVALVFHSVALVLLVVYYVLYSRAVYRLEHLIDRRRLKSNMGFHYELPLYIEQCQRAAILA